MEVFVFMSRGELRHTPIHGLSRAQALARIV